MRLCKSILCYSLLFVTFAFPGALYASYFTDVADSHPNTAAIKSLFDSQVIKGYPDGTFKPDQPVNRAEALAMILKAAGVPVGKSSVKIPFTDVPQDAWFFPMVQKGYALKKIKGYPDKTFRPNEPTSVGQALVLLTSFFEVSVKKIPLDTVIYGGLNPADWYARSAQYAKNQNILLPDENGHVDPHRPITRGQFAELVYRMKRVRETGKPSDITAGWITTEHLDNFWRLKHPPEWEVFKGLFNSVIWKRVESQAFFTRVWPASARLSISIVENAENAKTIYEKNYPGAKVEITTLTLSGRPATRISIPSRRIIDMVITLPNKKFLVFYGEYGEAPIGEFLKKKLETIVMSYEYVEKSIEPPRPVEPLPERMARLREYILVEGKWKEVTDMFPDRKLILTDAIGVGTGPVDYYYSAEANHTIKVERNSGTVLNIREGETSGF